MTLDWTIRVDQLVTFAGLIFFTGALWREIKALNADTRELKAAILGQSGVLVDMARQDTQLKEHDRRIEKLETSA